MKITSLIIVFQLICHITESKIIGEGTAYSFYRFRGPVSGQVYPVTLQNRQSVDYVAKPDYTYSYGVEDPQTGNSQTRKESRDGDAVKGEYSVLQSDGTVRTVRYVADPVNGFQATVHYSPNHGSSR